MSANGHRVSFGSDRNGLELVEMLAELSYAANQGKVYANYVSVKDICVFF